MVTGRWRRRQIESVAEGAQLLSEVLHAAPRACGRTTPAATRAQPNGLAYVPARLLPGGRSVARGFVGWTWWPWGRRARLTSLSAWRAPGVWWPSQRRLRRGRSAPAFAPADRPRRGPVAALAPSVRATARRAADRARAGAGPRTAHARVGRSWRGSFAGQPDTSPRRRPNHAGEVGADRDQHDQSSRRLDRRCPSPAAPASSCTLAPALRRQPADRRARPQVPTLRRELAPAPPS